MLGLLFVLLNIADLILTAILLRLEIGIEANPLLASMPFWGVAILKLSLPAAVVVWLYRRRHLLYLLNGGMAIVVVWDLSWLIGSV